MGRTFVRVNFTLVVRDALLMDICGDLLRFCERSNRPVAVKYFGSGISVCLQEHELCIEGGLGILLEYLLWPTCL